MTNDIWPSLIHAQVSFGCNPSRRSSVRKNVSYKRGERICWRWASKIPMKKIRRRERRESGTNPKIFQQIRRFVDLWWVTKVASVSLVLSYMQSAVQYREAISIDITDNTDNITLRFEAKQLLIHHPISLNSQSHCQEFTSLIVCAVGGLFVTTLEWCCDIMHPAVHLKIAAMWSTDQFHSQPVSTKQAKEFGFSWCVGS